MGLLKNFLKIFKGTVANGQHESAVLGLGLLIFEHTSEVIKAESLLKAAGVNVCVKGPPPEVRTGCDLAIEFPIISELKVSRCTERSEIRAVANIALIRSVAGTGKSI